VALKPDQMAHVAAPHATVSDKIRALAAAGAPRADIARFLGKRYQHVRNVLEGDAQSGGGYVLGKADLSGVRENPRPFENAADEAEWVGRERRPGIYWLRPRPDGSLVLPHEVAEALGLTRGDKVFATFKDDRFEIISADTALAEAQAIVAKYAKPGRSVVDEFIAERRAEAEREESGG
jgi:bifunctional DNA-binding transcriptional regulator/antitoxin component of YhaV-PrlF toxin-antitoxin module